MVPVKAQPSMYSLILKDLLIQKKMILLSFVYIVFFYMVMQGAGFIILPTALTAVTYMLVITSCAYDEKNKADVMLNSLPLKRLHIVLAKYLSILFYLAICAVVYMIITTLISLTGLPVEVYPVSLEGLAGGLLATNLIIGIYFPFYFKYGYIKTKFLNLILFFALYFGLTSSISFCYINKDVSWVNNLANLLLSLTDIQIFSFIALFTIIFMAVFFALSLKAYQSKDL